MPTKVKTTFLRSTVLALLNKEYEATIARSDPHSCEAVLEVLARLRAGILDMETRIWSLYSDDDDVCLFESEAVALQTKKCWEKAGANGIEGPFEHFEQYQLPKPPSRVYDAEMLKAILADDRSQDFYIQLNGGAVSRKTIYYQGVDSRGTPKYDVCNHIDDSYQVLSWNQLLATGEKARSHIGEALEKMALFWEASHDT